MGLLDLDIKGGIDTTLQRITDPFSSLFRNNQPDLKTAQARNDFPDGFQITEFVDKKLVTETEIKLNGELMPHIPFVFGGELAITKDYYPGSSEPTIQVLGSRESDIVINGRLKVKHFKPGDRAEALRAVPEEIQQSLENFRIRGNILRFKLGEFVRYGFLVNTSFSMKTRADIDYALTLAIIGNTEPVGCRVLNAPRTIPFDINQKLIDEVTAFNSEFSVIPESMPKSLADIINDGISDVAGAINNVTSFIDGFLNEVDDLRAAVSRGLGLIKHSRNRITAYQRRIGALSPVGQVSLVTGISSGYSNASYLTQSLSSTFSLLAFLAQLQSQLEKIRETEPLARHRVQSGDSLQALAVKFYNDSDQWKTIYDHNLLTDTELTVGAILEIPRIT